jgi:hypothetical protein
MMLAQDRYYDLLDQSGKREGLYLNMVGFDGTQHGECSTDSCMIMGNHCVNLKREAAAGYHGAETQILCF